MSNFKNSSSLSVAILISDIEEVKEITNVFRKLGIIPYFYEDLKSFWQGTIEKVPTIAILDVKKMSDGNLIIKNHPLVMADELPLLFYYSELTEPLLFSTQEIFHLGIIKKSQNYEGVLKGILKRINKMILLQQENHNLKLSLNAKNEELKLIELNLNSVKKVDHYQNLAKKLCDELVGVNTNQDFFTVIDNLVTRTEEFETYSVVELSMNGQKLISPLIHGRKHRAIPSIWLGQICHNGIELFAQNMASQLALEVLGHNSVALLINGQYSNPEYLIYLRPVDEQCFNYFDWYLFESFLNGLFNRQKIKELSLKNVVSKIQNSFEALSFLDSNSISVTANNKLQEVGDLKVISVDLSSIEEIILKNGQQRFFWQKFYKDFIAKVELQFAFDFQVFSFGVSQITFLLTNIESDRVFKEIKEFTDKFPYWKYFENNDAVVFQEVRPVVYMTPTSAFGYLARIKQKSDGVTSAVGRNTVVKWERENLNEI